MQSGHILAPCRAVETLVSQLVGEPVREHCDRQDRPRCCFELLADNNKT